MPPGPAQHEWFGDRVSFETFQWHYETFGLPPGAERVLTNRFNENQAYVIDGIHIGMQGHVEMTPQLVNSWLHTGARELPNVSTPAMQSADDIARDLDARIATLHRVAGDVYARWSQGLRL